MVGFFVGLVLWVLVGDVVTVLVVVFFVVGVFVRLVCGSLVVIIVVDFVGFVGGCHVGRVQVGQVGHDREVPVDFDGGKLVTDVVVEEGTVVVGSFVGFHVG